MLREIEGFGYEEIAEMLHINIGTVKSRLTRGRAALREALKSPALAVVRQPGCSWRASSQIDARGGMMSCQLHQSSVTISPRTSMAR